LPSPSDSSFQLTDLFLKILKWRNDLSLFFKDLTGLEPRPFQAEFFKEVTNLEVKNIVVIAGRSIGKTLSTSIVALWYTCVLSITENRPMKVVILAGSLKQAKIAYNYILEFIQRIPYLQRQLSKEPTQQEIKFKDGSWICPLPSSEKAIRGHHPDLLIVDEAAQVDENILYAAIPMTASSPYARHIFITSPEEGFSPIEEKWLTRNKFKYPEWKFFNWDAEQYLSKEQIEMLKQMLPEDKYLKEIRGQIYRSSGKVFRISDLRKCESKTIVQSEDCDVFAGIDWGYSPDPTAIVIAQEREGFWEILFTKTFLGEHHEDVLEELKEICLSYNVKVIFTDSTNKGENIRLASKGLPVEEVSFKAEKSEMLANLRLLVEQGKLKFDPERHQELIQQLIDYTYFTKHRDDLVDALMLALRARKVAYSRTIDITEFLKEAIVKRKGEVNKKERLNIWRKR